MKAGTIFGSSGLRGGAGIAGLYHLVDVEHETAGFDCSGRPAGAAGMRHESIATRANRNSKR
jgi:hypothetical protein